LLEFSVIFSNVRLGNGVADSFAALFTDRKLNDFPFEGVCCCVGTSGGIGLDWNAKQLLLLSYKQAQQSNTTRNNPLIDKCQ
jgi:hypothetical protein